MAVQVQFNNYNPFTKNEKGLIEGATDTKYQSTFLPIFQNAETQIKKMIVTAFLVGKSKYALRLALAYYISQIENKIPNTLTDKPAYINGLRAKTDTMIRRYYDKSVLEFSTVTALIIENAEIQKIKVPKFKNPKQLMEYVQKNKSVLRPSTWADAKAGIRVENYPKRISQYINQLATEPMTTYENGKKPISLWQKAELDIRHEKQMSMLNDLRTQGVQYAWTSSHPDCSKRCEKWQGKLMNINTDAHSELSGFRMKEKVDGHTVYCLQDIMNQKDKYGYNNNIISGFNCRHHLIPYQPGQLPPNEYDAKDVSKNRKINDTIRKMEREIRIVKTKEQLYNITDKSKALYYKKLAETLTLKYKSYCERHGFAWEQYRINIVR